MLDDVRVATPCNAEWDAMTGDDRVRFCPSCQKNVFDLSGMTRDEAEGFVRERVAAAVPTCIRFYRRADGTVLTSDCPVGVSRRRRRQVAAAAFGATIAAAGAAFGLTQESGATGAAHKLPPAPHVETEASAEVPRARMGDMAMPDLAPARPVDPKPFVRRTRDGEPSR